MEDFIYQEQIVTCSERTSPRRRRNNKILPPECHQSIFGCQDRISPRRQREIDCENLTSKVKISEPLGLELLERRRAPQISEGSPRPQVSERIQISEAPPQVPEAPDLVSVTTVIPEEVISEQVISPSSVISPVVPSSSIAVSVPLPPAPSTFSRIRSQIAPANTTSVQNIERKLPYFKDLMFIRDLYFRRNEPIPFVANLTSLTNSISKKSRWRRLLGNIPGRIKSLPDQGMPDMLIPDDIFPFIPGTQSKREMIQIRRSLAEANRAMSQVPINQSAEILSSINKNALSLDNFVQTGRLLASFPDYAIPIDMEVINDVNNSMALSQFTKIFSTVDRINLNQLQLNIANNPISQLISNNIRVLQGIWTRVGSSVLESRQEGGGYREIDEGTVDVMTIRSLQLGRPGQGVQRDIQRRSQIIEMATEISQIQNLQMPSIQDIIPDRFGIIQENGGNDSRTAEFMQVFQNKLREISDVIRNMKLDDLMKETIQIGLRLIALHDDNYEKIFGNQNFSQNQSSALQLIYATMFAQLEVAIEFINVMIYQYINIHILMTNAKILCNYMRDQEIDIIMCLEDPEDPRLTSFAHSLLYSLVNMAIINNVYLKSLQQSFVTLIRDYVNANQNDPNILKFYRDNQFLNHAVYCSLIYISFASAEEEVREWSGNLNDDLDRIRRNVRASGDLLEAVYEFFRNINVYTEDFREDIKRLLDINLLLVPNLIERVEMRDLGDSIYLSKLEEFVGRPFNI